MSGEWEARPAGEFTVVPLSQPQKGLGPPCPKCGGTTIRTYYSRADINGSRRALMLHTCHHCPSPTGDNQ